MKSFAGYIVVLIAGIIIGFGGYRLITRVDVPVMDTIIFRFDGSVTQLTPAPIKLTISNKEYIRFEVPDTFLLKEYVPYDTLGILHDYQATRYYKDLIVDNDTLKIDLYEEISRNRVMRRIVDWDVNFPVVTSTGPARELFLIGGLGYGGSSAVFSAEALYKDRQNRIVGAEIGYNSGVYVQAKAGIKF